MSNITLDDYVNAGLDQLHEWLRSGWCTPIELTELALAALKEFADPLNAIVKLAPERAHAEAAAATAVMKSGASFSSKLLGIPYGVKDILATGGGLPTSWGAAPLRNQQFENDATVIQLLRSSGAILTSKLATVELAGAGGYRTANNSLTGPAKNPWNDAYWTGGSSSGSAAAVSCGALPFALGSETGSSIVLPASYCGVTGVRPSFGLVSRYGSMTLSWSMDKLGPIARSVADCARVLEVIGVPDPNDPASSGRWFRYRPEQYEKRRVRFGILPVEIREANTDVARAVEAIIPSLERIGTVEEVDLPDLPYEEVSRIVIASEASSYFDEFIESGKLPELTAQEAHVVPLTYGMILAKDYIRALRVRNNMARSLSNVLSGVDILVAPTSGRTASRIDEIFDDSFSRFSRSQLRAASTLVGLPAVSLPIDVDSHRLPIGLLLVGGACEDESLLAAASKVERLIGWSARPPHLLAPHVVRA